MKRSHNFFLHFVFYFISSLCVYRWKNQEKKMVVVILIYKSRLSKAPQQYL